MYFSLIIPVYNRPDEIEELLASLTVQDYTNEYEIVIVEDGSSVTCQNVVEKYTDKLTISYYFKPNSGPGDSRNFGMKRAKGDYFIILDSDCIIPPGYLSSVKRSLQKYKVDCFGGPDAALDSFSDIQKAINFVMTSFITTGGIRGKSEAISKFQPRSFNMGLSRKAFEASGGFGNIHPGEDPDLSIRLWKQGYSTQLFPDAYVYHKRRIDWAKFYKQVNKFGKARPILDLWHPEYKKITFWFPSLFLFGAIASVLLLLFHIVFPAFLFLAYFLLIGILSSGQNKNLKVGAYSILAVCIQFYGYGSGFLQSFFKIRVLDNTPQDAFPELFFRK
ncbi:glycosyltransferase [Fluviicola sp.]|jgi:glycosyltransferase involved in cell wall biosynthesis|uniref:glycosyltransferase n=1 Tax=Fluviicola sp. TaxID=1917219 RepID=UPI002835E413|nr:glycosyltransferase [Fluviicola sp.]MDR0802566.1 glycosyltransferase [Fluviicola sp.]